MAASRLSMSALIIYGFPLLCRTPLQHASLKVRTDSVGLSGAGIEDTPIMGMKPAHAGCDF
jgi:hypothetical protein